MVQDVGQMKAQPNEELDELLDRLEHTTQLSRGVLGRVVADVLDHFGETAEAFVRRRHVDLQTSGLNNPEIWDRVSEELKRSRVSAPTFSARQLRRIVYG